MDCNKCKYINITELEQEKLKYINKRTTVIPRHKCTKYNKYLLHEWHMGKHLSRIQPCEECEFNESEV